MEITRCPWAQAKPNDQYITYHDTEWGVPTHDDRKLFEFVILEGAQAGLSWSTILGRRESYRRLFADFDPAAVARFSDNDVERLMCDAGIIRNRSKIRAAVRNAQSYLKIQQEFGSFGSYQWAFVNGTPIVNAWTRQDQIPAVSDVSERLSKDMYRRDFRFFGPTIAYAHMQACGMVNDHMVQCFRHAECGAV
jgi:DNA-3-methyladenine glycosylase I